MSFFVWFLLIVAGFTAIGVLNSIGSAVAARIRSGPRDDPALAERLREIEGRLADLESHAGAPPEGDERVLELEERVEFAERLLQQMRERERLGPGGP